ncbi:hypothetical protein [Ekhidna sp.]|uniref:hypothetical protein n=1 Tax=Ekhidna sp. TaxID=2608089 RepID=UPI003B5A4BD8
MEPSIFIARTLGVIYLTVGIGLFLFRETYILAYRKILENPGYALLGGFIAIVGGMAMVSYHNLWVSDWRVLVTIVGWIALIKGILLLLIPPYTNLFKGLLQMQKGKGITITAILMGVIFTYLGFFR